MEGNRTIAKVSVVALAAAAAGYVRRFFVTQQGYLGLGPEETVLVMRFMSSMDHKCCSFCGMSEVKLQLSNPQEERAIVQTIRSSVRLGAVMLMESWMGRPVMRRPGYRLLRCCAD